MKSAFCKLQKLLPDWVVETGHLTAGLIFVNILTIVGLHTNHGWYNPYTAYLLVFTFLSLLFIILYGTEGWSFRSVGILFLIIGDLFIYVPILLSHRGHTYDEEIRLSLARAFFVTGSAFALYGVAQWARAKRRRLHSKEGPTVLTAPDEVVD